MSDYPTAFDLIVERHELERQRLLVQHKQEILDWVRAHPAGWTPAQINDLDRLLHSARTRLGVLERRHGDG